MELGSVPRPPRKPSVLHEYPVGQAEHDEGRDAAQDEPPAAGEEQHPDRSQADDDEEVHAPTVGGVEGGERAEPRGEESRLGGLRHRLDHGAEGPVRSLPGAATGPRLEQCHPDEEHAPAREDDPPQTRSREGALGQRDEDAGGAVEEHGAGRTEEPCQPGSEDPPEGLAEHPDDEAPAGARRAPEAGPPAPRGHQQPDAQPELDPDGGGRRLDGVVGPDGHAAVHQMLDPRR